MARVVDLGTTRYDWIPTAAAVTNPATPTVAQMNAAGNKNISPYVSRQTSIGSTASDTVNDPGITDTANVVVPTIGNYEGTLVVFRDLESGAPTANDLLATFRNPVVGWIARREGFAHDVAYAAGQQVSLFLFMSDYPQASAGGGDGYLKLTIPLLQQGRFAIGVAVTA